MEAFVDNAPLPRTSLTAKIEDLEPGQSLCVPRGSRRSLAVMAHRVKQLWPGRKYRTADTADGPRVWRIS